MAIGTLYITTKDYSWSDNNVLLLDSGNLSRISSDDSVVDVHTTVEDLGYQNIDVACQAAQTVTLVDIAPGTIAFSDSNFNSYGRLFYELYRNKHKVSNFGILEEIDLTHAVPMPSRPTSAPMLWISGAGVTNGCDMPIGSRWGDLLAEKMGMPVVHLSHGHGSVAWTADQILRSDIDSADIVIWEVPESARVEVSDGWNLQPITQQWYTSVASEQKYWAVEYFGSNAILNKSLHEIAQVINFCSKVGAKLYLLNLADSVWIPFMLRKHKNFIDCVKDLQIEKSIVTYIDIGADESKPGPAQHSIFADQIFEFIHR